MGFLDVAFRPPELVFTPHFLKIALEVKASGPPHDLKLWLGYGIWACSLYNTFAPRSHFVCQLYFTVINLR